MQLVLTDFCDEILLLIIGHLDIISRIQLLKCTKRFRLLASDGSLWKILKLSQLPKMYNSRDFDNLQGNKRKRMISSTSTSSTLSNISNLSSDTSSGINKHLNDDRPSLSEVVGYIFGSSKYS